MNLRPNYDSISTRARYINAQLSRRLKAEYTATRTDLTQYISIRAELRGMRIGNCSILESLKTRQVYGWTVHLPLYTTPYIIPKEVNYDSSCC